MKKIIRVATHSGSLENLLRGQLRFMSSYYKIIGVGSKGELENGETVINKLAKNEGVAVFPVEMTRVITPFKDLKALFRLYKLFKKEQPFIVHSHTPKAGTLAMIAAKIAKVPHRFHTVAGLPLVEATGIKRRILNYVEKVTYASATKVYPNSEGLKNFILESKFTTPDKTKVIGFGSSNGIDTTHFNPSLFSKEKDQKLREKLGLKSEDFIFIFLGRIVKDKGINELVNAFIEVRKKHSNAKLLLVGYFDEETAQLNPETIQEIKSNKNITVVTWQEDVRPFLSIANALTFPSYREGFPNVVMQASAMSLPSIVCNINGCNEIISDGLNGVIIPVKDTKALKNSMKKLMEEKEFYQSLVQNSRAPICEKYERKFIWESILEEYEALS